MDHVHRVRCPSDPASVHHSAAAFTVTSPGAPNHFTPFKYSGIHGRSQGVPWVPAGTTLGSGAHFDLRLGDASLSSENSVSPREHHIGLIRPSVCLRWSSIVLFRVSAVLLSDLDHLLPILEGPLWACDSFVSGPLPACEGPLRLTDGPPA